MWDTYVDGDWVKAKGTTLGADNGLGVAAIMAVLEDNNLKQDVYKRQTLPKRVVLYAMTM